MDTLVTIHSWFRWVVLAALLGSAVLALVRASRGDSMEGGADRPFAVTAILFDLQVTLGLILWIFDKGWTKGFFIAAVHPLFMLLAVGAFHAFVSRARRTASFRVVGVGAVVALAIVVAAIPWA